MQSGQIWNLTRWTITSIVLFGVWLLFSDSFDPFHLIAGAVGAVLIAALTFDEFIAPHEASLRFFMPRLPMLAVYLGYLVYALYVSSWKMLTAVITGHVNPRIVHFRTRLRSDLARMVLSNSITFTPGTITLDLNEDHLTVHWLFSTTGHMKAAGDAVKGPLERLLHRVWV